MKFKNLFVIILVFLCMISCTTIENGSKEKEKEKPQLVEWGTVEGKRRLQRSSHVADFFSLSNNFEGQANKIYCGMASSAIVLNALLLRKSDNIPQDSSSINKNEKKYMSKGANPFFKKFTQNNILNKKTKKKIEILGKPMRIKGEVRNDFGIQLHQLLTIIESHGAKVEMRTVSDTAEVSKIKSEIVKNLRTSGDYVLVNYSRKSLGQPGGGHISPLGAYDEKSDSFLVMDVNPNKAPWVWVSSNDLIESMRTFDTIANRGYLLISN